MSEPADDPSARLPPDPTFSPEAFVSVSRLLRGGVIVFVIFATVGMALYLLFHPGESVSALLAAGTSIGPDRLVSFAQDLSAGRPSAFVALGIFAMIAVVIGRVVFVAVHAFRGHERPLAVIATTVVILLLFGLFVVGAIVG